METNIILQWLGIDLNQPASLYQIIVTLVIIVSVGIINHLVYKKINQRILAETKKLQHLSLRAFQRLFAPIIALFLFLLARIVLEHYKLPHDIINIAVPLAMALAELITTRYPKDTLDVVVFGNDAWQVQIKDLPYLQVGPFHTNTVAGLELAMDILRKRKMRNKQIFMITDGKPTCLKQKDGSYYKNSMGHDPRIINKTINLAIQCRKLRIPITTFMIAHDPYLQKFVEDFTEANKGKASIFDLYGQIDWRVNQRVVDYMKEEKAGYQKELERLKKELSLQQKNCPKLTKLDPSMQRQLQGALAQQQRLESANNRLQSYGQVLN